jgi:hypothetical protein
MSIKMMSNIKQLYQDQQDEDEYVILNTSNDILVQKLSNFKQTYINCERETSLASQLKKASLKHYISIIEQQLLYRKNISNYQQHINNILNNIHNHLYDILLKKIVSMINEYNDKDTYIISEDLFISIINKYKMIEKLFDIHIFEDDEQNIFSLYTNLLYNTKCINQNILNLINIKNLDIIDIKNKGIAAENELFMNKNIYIEYGFYSHKFTITITYPSFDKL